MSLSPHYQIVLDVGADGAAAAVERLRGIGGLTLPNLIPGQAVIGAVIVARGMSEGAARRAVAEIRQHGVAARIELDAPSEEPADPDDDVIVPAAGIARRARPSGDHAVLRQSGPSDSVLPGLESGSLQVSNRRAGRRPRSTGEYVLTNMGSEHVETENSAPSQARGALETDRQSSTSAPSTGSRTLPQTPSPAGGAEALGSTTLLETGSGGTLHEQGVRESGAGATAFLSPLFGDERTVREISSETLRIYDDDAPVAVEPQSGSWGDSGFPNADVIDGPVSNDAYAETEFLSPESEADVPATQKSADDDMNSIFGETGTLVEEDREFAARADQMLAELAAFDDAHESDSSRSRGEDAMNSTLALDAPRESKVAAVEARAARAADSMAGLLTGSGYEFTDELAERGTQESSDLLATDAPEDFSDSDLGLAAAPPELEEGAEDDAGGLFTSIEEQLATAHRANTAAHSAVRTTASRRRVNVRPAKEAQKASGWVPYLIVFAILALVATLGFVWLAEQRARERKAFENATRYFEFLEDGTRFGCSHLEANSFICRGNADWYTLMFPELSRAESDEAASSCYAYVDDDGSNYRRTVECEIDGTHPAYPGVVRMVMREERSCSRDLNTLNVREASQCRHTRENTLTLPTRETPAIHRLDHQVEMQFERRVDAYSSGVGFVVAREYVMRPEDASTRILVYSPTIGLAVREQAVGSTQPIWSIVARREPSIVEGDQRLRIE